MAFFTDRQFAVVVGLGCLGAWWMYQKSKTAAETAGEAVSDGVWWWGHQADNVVDGINGYFTLDGFDRKHRHKQDLMNDAQYERWKAFVIAGQIQEPVYE